jgi:hypothetical protein
MTDMQDKDLDGLLALAARDRPTPSPALMDRVLADALALQPQPLPGWVAPAPAPAPGLLARLAALFGGGPVLAGVCSAMVAGVALGYLQPASLDLLTGGLAGTETLDLFPSADFLTNEG